ncbi:acetyltransferase [Alteromonas oceanisediminis]|uniref:acetyltransferase n=1 Tax=Alteromonas oceanisediminis TaxID=2836180 RepID=UPI001BD96E76|nr:acetyltransferase [Alteromonas oceanisediminis]MBT0587783.1 acetyltransferase [Alteromonas oceanisediminis]
MTSTLYIFGAGGHSQVVGDIAVLSKRYTQICYFDDLKAMGQALLGGTVTGTIKDGVQRISDAQGNSQDTHQAFVALGNNEQRRKVTEQLMRHQVSIATLIHPGAIVATSVSLGAGTLVVAGAVINPNTRVGEGCIINTNASVDHDCAIADFVHIAPASAIAGGVTIEQESFLGIGCRVIPGVHICKQATVGAGAVVIRDVSTNSTVVGVPANEI